MTWTLHERTTTRSTVPHVRISGDLNSFRFNSLVAEILVDVRALTLMWDGDRIAFEPVPWSDPNGFALYHQSAIAWVQCWSFIHARGYRKNQAWTLTERGNLIIGDPVRQPAGDPRLPRAVQA